MIIIAVFMLSYRFLAKILFDSPINCILDCITFTSSNFLLLISLFYNFLFPWIYKNNRFCRIHIFNPESLQNTWEVFPPENFPGTIFLIVTQWNTFPSETSATISKQVKCVFFFFLWRKCPFQMPVLVDLQLVAVQRQLIFLWATHWIHKYMLDICCYCIYFSFVVFQFAFFHNSLSQFSLAILPQLVLVDVFSSLYLYLYV